MITTLSIRELTRSGAILADYDYINIEDRKSHQYKGVFIPQRYADEVKEFIDQKIARDRQESKNRLLEFAGIAHGDFGTHTVQQLKQNKHT